MKNNIESFYHGLEDRFYHPYSLFKICGYLNSNIWKMELVSLIKNVFEVTKYDRTFKILLISYHSMSII